MFEIWPDSSFVNMRPLAQSQSTTWRSSLPDARSWPLGEKLMQFTQPSWASSRCSSCRRFTNEGSPYHCCWNDDCVRIGSWLSCRECSEWKHRPPEDARLLPRFQFIVLHGWVRTWWVTKKHFTSQCIVFSVYYIKTTCKTDTFKH